MIKEIVISPIIVENQQHYIDLLTIGKSFIKKKFGAEDTTKAYPIYNVFSITSTDLLMYKLFNEIKTTVRDNLGYEQPLWMQAWLNFQNKDNLLNWHNHLWDWHGYVCIDPKNTKTIFEDFEIENKIGQIYFGEGHKPHKVEAVEPFSGHRITIGYDITAQANVPFGNTGLIPI